MIDPNQTVVSREDQEELRSMVEQQRFRTQWFPKRALAIWEKHLKPLGPFKAYLEVGVGEGQSLLWAEKHLLTPDAKIVAIDHWHPSRENFKSNVELVSDLRDRAMRNLRPLVDAGRLMIFERSSLNALCCLAAQGTRKFDLAYIDGSHRACDAIIDLCLAWELLKPLGVLVVDDLHLDADRRRSAEPKVREAVAAFKLTHGDVEVCWEQHPQVAFRKMASTPHLKRPRPERIAPTSPTGA